MNKPQQISAKLTWQDRWNNFKVRSSFNRDDYKVNPGIYSLGNPTPESPVMVSANYKLSFDILRQSLEGLNVWILVLDTKGVNVWCAAGKGTFGTEELINRIKIVQLDKIVSHRKLILPQLGATGVAAHEVKAASGFNVIFGPVRADDIKTFIQSGMKASPKMREVTFSFKDRLELVPIELRQGLRYFLIGAVVFYLIGGAQPVINLLLAYLAGAMLGPLFLPWLPGRAFSVKGFYAGALVFFLLLILKTVGINYLEISAWGLMIVSLASFLTMNFTGASTYASPSGVVKEMRLSMPLQLAGFLIGFGLWLVQRFLI